MTLTPSCLGMGCHRIKPVADLEQFTPFLRSAARLHLILGHLTGLEVEEHAVSAAKSLDLPLSLHTATRRQGRMRGAGEKTLRQKSRLDDDRINRSTASVRAKLRIPNQDFGAT